LTRYQTRVRGNTFPFPSREVSVTHLTAIVAQLKKRRSIARKKIQDKYVERVTEIRKRVEKRLADENKKV